MRNKIDFTYHHIKENKGSFEFSDDSFRFKSPLNDMTVPYQDVERIERVFGTRNQQIAVITAKYADPNCYNIVMTGSRRIFLQASFAEQDDLKRRLGKLQRKIYGGNRLGVGLASRIPDRAALKKMDEQFERERPRADYSLANAVEALAEMCGITIIDNTAFDGVNGEEDDKSIESSR